MLYEGRAGTRYGSCGILLLLVMCLGCCLAWLLDLLRLCSGQSRRVALLKQLLLQELLGLPPRLGPPQADPVVPLHPGQSKPLSW